MGLSGVVSAVKARVLLIILAGLAVFFLGLWAGGGGNAPEGEDLEPHSHDELHDSVYVCPMACIPPRDQKGSCPVCGMELVPVPRVPDPARGVAVRLSQEQAAAAGIRTSRVQRRVLKTEIRLFGRIDYDPAHMSYVSAFMPGVIDRVYVKRAGQFVRWGDPLFDIYSSDLLETQYQLMEALKVVPGFLAFQEGQPYAVQDAPVVERKGGQGEKGRAAVEDALKRIEGIRHKMKILGLPKRDIDEFMKSPQPTGIATVYSPLYGQVVEQNAFEGQYVNRGARIFAIGDPTYVWARLNAYESDFAWIRNGQEVQIVTESYPGEVFKGKVIYVSPVFNQESRSFDVGAILPEMGGKLKANMLVRATVKVELAEKEPPLVIPDTAPLITGTRAVVYVSLPEKPGYFEGREILLGPKGEGYYVVREGLREGDVIVEHGAFKIDSEAQILSRGGMMDFAGEVPAAGYGKSPGSAGVGQDYDESKARIGTLQEERPKETRRRPGLYGGSGGIRPPQR